MRLRVDLGMGFHMGCRDSLGSLDDSRVEAEGLFNELDLFGYGERLFLRAVAASRNVPRRVPPILWISSTMSAWMWEGRIDRACAQGLDSEIWHCVLPARL